MRLPVLSLAILLSTMPAAQAQDAAGGEKLFKQRCSVCHEVDRSKPRKLGTYLNGVIGRKVASVPGTNYSAALRKQSFKWDEAKLDSWLANPGAMVPGTSMVIRVAKPEERKAIIAYLKSLK